MRISAVRRRAGKLPQRHIHIVVDQHRQERIQPCPVFLVADRLTDELMQPNRNFIRLFIIVPKFRRVKKRLLQHLFSRKITVEHLYKLL